MDEITILKDNFDVRAFLDDQGVAYALEGDNVSTGWMNIKCLFCSDHANHLGVRLAGGSYHCWLCDETGDAISLIRAVLGCGFPRAFKVLESYQGRVPLWDESTPKVSRATKVLPDEFVPIEAGREPELVKRWFDRRRFSLDICQVWRLGWCEFGSYALHLIVPVFLDGDLVSFQAADLTGKASSKYRSCPDERSILPLKSCLYGLDEAVKASGPIILVEGVTDKWRLGVNAVALFGKGWKYAQIDLLANRAGDNRLIRVLLDLDAMQDGEYFQRTLEVWFNRTQYIKLEPGDPKDPDQFSEDLIRKVVMV